MLSSLELAGLEEHDEFHLGDAPLSDERLGDWPSVFPEVGKHIWGILSFLRFYFLFHGRLVSVSVHLHISLKHAAPPLLPIRKVVRPGVVKVLPEQDFREITESNK